LRPANRDSIGTTALSGGSFPSRVIARRLSKACCSVCCAEHAMVRTAINMATEDAIELNEPRRVFLMSLKRWILANRLMRRRLICYAPCVQFFDSDFGN
jgi:hypothetical protein